MAIPTVTEKLLALMRSLRIEMNGAVSQAMRERGAHYGLNYGVSLPTLRQAALPYAPDPELAEALWRQDIRELRLAALFVADPAQMTLEQIERWSSSWRTAEEAEQSVAQLFSKTPEALAAARGWLGGDTSSDLQRLAALHLLRLAAPASAAEQLEPFLSEPLWRQLPAAPASFALRELWRHHPALRPAISELLPLLDPALADEVRWQIDYL